jgi:hypothetical protein
MLPSSARRRFPTDGRVRVFLRLCNYRRFPTCRGKTTVRLCSFLLLVSFIVRFIYSAILSAIPLGFELLPRQPLQHLDNPHASRWLHRLLDAIGVYLNPPDHAVVLCCDEKSQCQALQRSQPGLPLAQGHIRTVTHDYYRHGTVTLFAALDYLSGKIISQVAPRHRHNEWLKFLNKLDSEITGALSIHRIVDNYSTHKHQKVPSLAGASSALSSPLHSDQRFLDEHGRTFLPRSKPTSHPTRQLRLGRRTG